MKKGIVIAGLMLVSVFASCEKPEERCGCTKGAVNLSNLNKAIAIQYARGHHDKVERMKEECGWGCN